MPAATQEPLDCLRLGVVQLRVSTHRRQRNLERSREMVADAAARGCRLVVLPEAVTTGLDLPKSRELAAPVPGAGIEELAHMARTSGVYLAAGVLEMEDDRVYSTAVLLDDQGALLHKYRRIYVYDLEAFFLHSGDLCQVVDTALGRIGLVVGYDIQFPEVPRQLFAQGVELILCPAVLLQPFAESVRLMVEARAAENCCYVAFASATGENTLAGLTFMGGSVILQSPVGLRPYANDFRRQTAVLAEAERQETLLTADLDLAALRRLQTANPLYKDFQRSDFFLGKTTSRVGARPGTGEP